MLHRPLRRAAALSLGALLAFAGAASADSLFADADAVTPVVDGSRHLGDVGPGATVSADVRFVLVCAGLQHVDAGQSVVLTANGGIVPLDGAIVSVSPVTLAPLTTAWAADGSGCPDPVPAQEGGSLSHVVLRAPTTAGLHTFTVAWIRGLQPLGSNDANAFSRTPTSVDFTVRVVGNAAPTLTVPASFTVEGDTTGGWAADWSAVSATDPEDSPDPSPTCLPAAGTVLLVGTTTQVTCSVTDLAGASDSDAFDVTVEDTKAPVLTVPDDITVTTSDPTGRVVTFSEPTATDIVDPSPSVICDHATGDTFAVGTTRVTCTATDASRKSATATFDVTVVLVASHTASSTWLEPVDGMGTTAANRGRTLPVKVRLFVDGVERTTGDAELTLTPCGGGSAVSLDLDWSGGRWNHSLDTSMLAGACYDVGATIDGLSAGSFRLELRGEESVGAATKRVAATTLPVERREKPSNKKAR